jgi:hypothetical protein
LAATADFVHWSDQDHERFSGLQSRVYTTTGALRQAIESTRALVIRHPEYDVGRWREKATKGIDLQSVPHKASSASCFCGLSSVSKRLY